jgi:hypothetical protein
MRTRLAVLFCSAVAVLLLLGWTTSARADAPQIERIRIGLPAGRSGQESGRSRNGSWAPVAITLKAGAEGNPQGAYRLRIESADLEELTYQSTASVPALAGNSERTVLAYIVPQGDGANFKVQLETTSGTAVQTISKLTRDASKDEVLNPADVCFFAVGAGLSQLKRAAEKLDKPEAKEADPNQPKQPGEAPPGADFDPDAGKRQFVFAEDASLLPDRWFGYDAVDIVVLATGKADFVNQLAQDSESARRNAMLEWVRRGGQLVLSVGRNHQEVSKLLQKMPLIDCKITGVQKLELANLATGWCQREGRRVLPRQAFEVATLVPGKSVHTMLRDGFAVDVIGKGGREGEERSVIVESSCGLGRVILVAFDLDTPPFTTWEGQLPFWTRLQTEVAPYMPVRGKGMGMAPGMPRPPVIRRGRMGAMWVEEEPTSDMRTVIKRSMENFDEVPTVSFGVVALFILFYIVLVGPLDYFVLKKLFKRLEWTWVTFPVTVLLVSVAAYATAYALKGDETRINKIDLVDIDLHEPNQIYGQTWFTLFSPRAQSYTLGIEPAAGTWSAPLPAGAPTPVLTLLEGGERTPRSGLQGLFPRPYEYTEDGSGLMRVPVPVWATRSFTASWRAPLKAKEPVIGITDDIGPIRRSEGDKLSGRITNNLQVKLLDAVLFYREKWYKLDTLAPGESRRLEKLFDLQEQGQGRPLNEWFGSGLLAPGTPEAPSGRPIPYGAQGRSVYLLMKELMFYRQYSQGVPDAQTNAGLRSFDQTWRLKPLPQYPVGAQPRYRDEAILIARAPMLVDKSEVVAEHPASPSQLWVGALPEEHKERPRVPGFSSQETYIRVFIPVGSR